MTWWPGSSCGYIPSSAHSSARTPAGPGPAVRQAGERPAEDGPARPAVAGTAQEVQERQAASQRRDDEVLQGKRGQPAGGLPADDPAADYFLLAVQRAALHRRLAARSPAPVRVYRVGGAEREAYDHLRRSPLRQAAVPDRRLATPVHARDHRDRAHRGAERDDDVHDRPAERQAWSHADQR